MPEKGEELMVENINKDEVVKDLSGMSNEDKAKAWMDSVRTGVNSLLDVYLPISKIGYVGVHYTPDKTKAASVVISVKFEFDKTIDTTKQIVSE